MFGPCQPKMTQKKLVCKRIWLTEQMELEPAATAVIGQQFVCCGIGPWHKHVCTGYPVLPERAPARDEVFSPRFSFTRLA